MPDDRDERVEFLDSAPPPVSQDEPLPASVPRSRLAFIAVGVLAVTVVAVLTVSHVGSPAPQSTASVAHPPSISLSPLAPSSGVTEAPLTDYPVSVIRRAARAACRGSAPCRVDGGDAASLRRARAALGPVRDVQVRTIGPGRALIVAALRTDGAQLLAVSTRPGVRVAATRLGIRPPIAVQSQHNGHDRLIVVVSGSVDSVPLLGSPRIQHWLAGLSAD